MNFFYFTVMIHLRFKDGMRFLTENSIKTYNYSKSCQQNLAGKKFVNSFEFKLSNETYSKSTELDLNGDVITTLIRDPSSVKMRFAFELETEKTDSQAERNKQFKERKKEERRKYIFKINN